MDEIRNDTILRLQEAIKFVKKRTEDIVLFLVIKMKSSNNYYNQYDYSTEFFSEEELSDYIKAIESLGIYRDISYGEDEFIEKISKNYFDKYPQKYKIVFNTTGSKRIRSRSALIPAICEMINIKYASSDILTCSILENKIHTIGLLNHYGFPVPHSWYYHPNYGWMGSKPPKNTKLIIKPSAESASIGITQNSIGCFSTEFEHRLIEVANILGESVIVQEFIDGWEVEVPVLNLKEPVALPPMGIEVDGDKYLHEKFLSFESVYADNYDYYRFDQISPRLSASLTTVAKDSFRMLDLCGTVRVDFRIQDENHYYITDYNNSPHLTRFHSTAKSLMSLGFEYQDLFCLLIYYPLLMYIQN
jgi:D-alanine-D-alanine ligase and related ATP-grasp enzymes